MRKALTGSVLHWDQLALLFVVVDGQALTNETFRRTVWLAMARGGIHTRTNEGNFPEGNMEVSA